MINNETENAFPSYPFNYPSDSFTIAPVFCTYGSYQIGICFNLNHVISVDTV